MRNFLARLHLPYSKEKSEKDVLTKEKFPPLKKWPPEPQQSERASLNPAEYTTLKPLPDIISAGHVDHSQASTVEGPDSTAESTPNVDEDDEDQVPELPQQIHELSGKSSRRTVNRDSSSDVHKKVAFKSPTHSPTSSSDANKNSTRYQPVNPRDPRGSTSSVASKPDLGTTSRASARTALSNNRALSPLGAQSLRSGTPYSQMSSSGSRILAATSWSEVTEVDLVSNLGSRERTRQEVLFEIISSEERYVNELAKMKDTFIDPLLHPFSSSSMTPSIHASTPNLDYEFYRSDSPAALSNDQLPPIAARFMTPTPTPQPAPKDSPIIDEGSLETDEDDEAEDQVARGGFPSPRRPLGSSGQVAKLNHPRSPYRASATKKNGGTTVPFPTRSHNSLPPPPRPGAMAASTQSLGKPVAYDRERNVSQAQSSRKVSVETPPKSGVLRKFRKGTPGTPDRESVKETVLGDSISPQLLPEDLRICLEVIDSGVFDGHKQLSEALYKRYADQYPLVRSLADVFVSNSNIFNDYSIYVLHLERALEQADDALSSAATKKPKKQDAGDWQKVCRFLQRLEQDAAEKGETGLAITLSKPFQRLLKYPLLFQNLLFHTDPSTTEYEATLQMVAEVEKIVRSIEDEKIQKEERDKTRDVFARIDGLEKVRQLAQPKPSRVLLEERPINGAVTASQINGDRSKSPASPPPTFNGKNVRGKSSFKRLSDVLGTSSGSVGSKKDLWLVVFNDVVLQCQRTGTTSLPLVATTNSRAASMPDLQGKSKYATTGRRNSHTKPRNLYKFIKIETWDIGGVIQPRQGVVSMDEVIRSRTQATMSVQPRIVPMPDDDEDKGVESDDSDRKSKMSFSYWGADKVTVQKPAVRGRVPPRGRGGAVSYGRESSANAKFGSRLVSNDSTSPRPTSRRTQVISPSSRKMQSEDGHGSASSRPGWNSNTHAPTTGRSPIIPAPHLLASRRPRNTSTPSAPSKMLAPTSSGKGGLTTSPAPSEDSGVGLYRKIIQKNPSLNRVI
ncbi:Dbl homology domain-containing protein [Fistulina hepatica ATCC 64428]|nr:Dbl homology domain-containing protein [Fistulina hepatica ATCC 64428]